MWTLCGQQFLHQLQLLHIVSGASMRILFLPFRCMHGRLFFFQLTVEQLKREEFYPYDLKSQRKYSKVCYDQVSMKPLFVNRRIMSETFLCDFVTLQRVFIQKGAVGTRYYYILVTLGDFYYFLKYISPHPLRTCRLVQQIYLRICTLRSNLSFEMLRTEVELQWSI